MNKQLTLDKINNMRHKHQAPALVWDNDVALYAQKWANAGKFVHSNGRYGENLALVCASTPQEAINISIALWYNENKLYDFEHGLYKPGVGHFTAMVWKSSKRLGVGIKLVDNNRYLVVANFDPPGNIIGKFKENVSLNLIQ